jgi:hypothetical protein
LPWLSFFLQPYTRYYTGLRDRDKELGARLLRIFYGTKAFGDIKYALQKFLVQRKDDRKQKTIESALRPIIVK